MRSLRSYCFSPAVMLATWSIEWLLAAWVVYRYRMDGLGRLIGLILVLLGTFQAVEFVICEYSTAREWALLGYLAITWLPALALQLALRLHGSQTHLGYWAGYGLAAGWSAAFLLFPTLVTDVACQGNYVILSLSEPASWMYGFYYYGLLVAGFVLAIFGRSKSAPKIRSARGWLALSYLLLIVPTYTVNQLDPATLKGIPSIMCGFALSFAVILVLRILPLVGTRRQK